MIYHPSRRMDFLPSLERDGSCQTTNTNTLTVAPNPLNNGGSRYELLERLSLRKLLHGGRRLRPLGGERKTALGISGKAKARRFVDGSVAVRVNSVSANELAMRDRSDRGVLVNYRGIGAVRETALCAVQTHQAALWMNDLGGSNAPRFLFSLSEVPNVESSNDPPSADAGAAPRVLARRILGVSVLLPRCLLGERYFIATDEADAFKQPKSQHPPRRRRSLIVKRLDEGSDAYAKAILGLRGGNHQGKPTRPYRLGSELRRGRKRNPAFAVKHSDARQWQATSKT